MLVALVRELVRVPELVRERVPELVRERVLELELERVLELELERVLVPHRLLSTRSPTLLPSSNLGIVFYSLFLLQIHIPCCFNMLC